MHCTFYQLTHCSVRPVTPVRTTSWSISLSTRALITLTSTREDHQAWRAWYVSNGSVATARLQGIFTCEHGRPWSWWPQVDCLNAGRGFHRAKALKRSRDGPVCFNECDRAAFSAAGLHRDHGIRQRWDLDASAKNVVILRAVRDESCSCVHSSAKFTTRKTRERGIGCGR